MGWGEVYASHEEVTLGLARHGQEVGVGERRASQVQVLFLPLAHHRCISQASPLELTVGDLKDGKPRVGVLLSMKSSGSSAKTPFSFHGLETKVVKAEAPGSQRLSGELCCWWRGVEEKGTCVIMAE